MSSLWNKNIEKDFFIKSLKFATPEQLFYLTKDRKFMAYWPKNYEGLKNTLQSRNSLIGSYTERWTTDLFKEIGERIGGYSVQGVVCNSLGLTNKSSADVAICKNNYEY